jgi:hypothetical protein
VELQLPCGPAAVVATLALWQARATVIPAPPASGRDSEGLRVAAGRAAGLFLRLTPDPLAWSAGEPGHGSGRPTALAGPDPMSNALAWAAEDGTYRSFAQLAQRAAVLAQRSAAIRAGLDRPVRVALTLPPQAPLFLDQLLTLRSGDTLVRADPTRLGPAAGRALLREREVDVLYCTTAQMETLTAGAGTDAGELPALLWFTGRPCSQRLWQRLQALAGTRVLRSVTTPWGEVAVADADRQLGAGLAEPLADADMAVIDPEFRLRPTGVSGELVACLPATGRGGLLVPDPWSGTPGGLAGQSGRIARLRADGLLEDAAPATREGRIEAALREMPGIDAVAAVRMGRGGRPDALTVFVARADGARITDVALRTELRQRLGQELPSLRFRSLPRLPLTPDGEFDTARLALVTR